MELIKKQEFDKIKNLDISIYNKLGIIAEMCRYNTLVAVKKAGSGHLGSSLSSMDIVVWLYYYEMNTVDVGIDNVNRDIYFSSKGHDVPGQYAVLHSLGILSDEKLLSLRRLNGIDGHPDVGINGIEANSGSLGMGISKAKGMAWAKEYQKFKGHVYVMTGDGEFQEGQNFEALQTVVQQKIYGLTVIMDHNKVQSDKLIDQIISLGNLRTKIESFGWEVYRIDGNDLRSIETAFQYRKEHPDKNIFIIADTIKGKGVSFMEHPESMLVGNGLYPWHAGAPDDVNFNKAIDELKIKIQNKISSLDITPIIYTDIEQISNNYENSIPLNSLGEPISEAAINNHKLSVSSEYIVEAYGKALVNAGMFHPELIVLDADLSSDCRLRNFENNINEQFIENGIAEQDMVSMAGGLARIGLLPVVNSFASFLASRANEQIYNNATEKTKIIYGFHYAGLIPAGPGKSHQSIRDISLIGALPNVEILQPCNAIETSMILNYCINITNKNSVIRMNIGPSPQKINLPANYTLTYGEGVPITHGDDAILFSYGPVMLNEALIASELLTAEGFGLKVINMPWLNRVDISWFEDVIEKYDRIFVLDDHSIVGGLGDFLLSELVGNKILNNKSFIKYGVEGYPACGTPIEALSYHRIDGNSLAKRILLNK